MSEIPYFRIARMQGGTRAINSAYRGCNCSKRKARSNLSFHSSFSFIIKRGDTKNRDIGILTIVYPFFINVLKIYFISRFRFESKDLSV